MKLSFLPSVLLSLGLSACLQGGTCTTQQGTVTTYAFGGSWKKSKGYTEGERTAEELKKNYDVLIIEPGGVNGQKARMCLVRVLDGVASGTLFQANYTRDDKLKTVAIEYVQTAKDYTNPGAAAAFTFVGSCNTTQMKLNYSDSKLLETYDIRNTTTAVGACVPDANASQ